MKMTFEDLQKVLEAHKKWLLGEAGGQKADLKGVDLFGVNLANVNLMAADLQGAALKRALLWSAST